MLENKNLNLNLNLNLISVVPLPLKIMYLVFEGLRFSLFDRNYLLTLIRVPFIFQVASFRVGAEVITVVSSANFTTLAVSSQLFMSLTYMRKSIGPRMEP